MEYYRLKFQYYGVSALSREDAIRKGQDKIKADPKGFVVDAELYKDRRPLWRRLIGG